MEKAEEDADGGQVSGDAGGLHAVDGVERGQVLGEGSTVDGGPGGEAPSMDIGGEHRDVVGVGKDGVGPEAALDADVREEEIDLACERGGDVGLRAGLGGACGHWTAPIGPGGVRASKTKKGPGA